MSEPLCKCGSGLPAFEGACPACFMVGACSPEHMSSRIDARVALLSIGLRPGPRRRLRDDAGRYAVGFEALCVCGHPKGHHAAGANGRSLGECLAGTHAMFPGDHCECLGFRKSRAKKGDT